MLRAAHLVTASACLLAGCVPISSFQSARTLGAGKGELLVAGTTLRVDGIEVSHHINGNNSEEYVFPTLFAGYRHGVTDWLDLGVRLYAPGAELETKLQLFRAEGAPGLDLALAVSGGAWAWEMGGGYESPLLYSRANLLLGFRVTRSLDVVAAPLFLVERANLERYVGPEELLLSGSAGGSLAVHWRPIRGFTLVPEFTYSRQVTNFGRAAFSSLSEPARMQFGVGILF